MPYQDWHIQDFSGGLIDAVDRHLIPDNASYDCQNFICETIGRLRKRRGQSRLNGTSLGASAIQGLYSYYKESGARHLICAHNGIIYRWDTTSSTWVSVQSGLSTSAQMFFESCANYMVAFNGVSTPVKWDGTTASVLANAPTDGQYPTLHKEKLFVAPSGSPSQVWWSTSFYPEQWPSVNYWSFNEGDGDSITCLKPYMGELIIFKRRSIHTLRGSSVDDFRSDTLERQVGAVGHRACALAGIYLYFVGDEGIYRFNGMTATNISNIKIPRYWEDSINHATIDKAAVAYWNGLLWFALPGTGSTYNNVLIIYDPTTESFWPMSGINAQCFQQHSPTNSGAILYSGDAVAGYVNQQDTGDNDFTSTIVSAYYRTKTFEKGSPERQAKAKKIFVTDSIGSVADATLKVSLDNGSFATVTNKADDGKVRYLRMSSTKWRYISFELSHSMLGPCEVRGILTQYKPKRKPKVRNS
jgi:hypothetical protein